VVLNFFLPPLACKCKVGVVLSLFRSHVNVVKVDIQPKIITIIIIINIYIAIMSHDISTQNRNGLGMAGNGLGMAGNGLALWDPRGRKIIPWFSHLREIFCTLAVGKSYLSYLFT
jgi:flagellar biosynthesis protein FliQ